MEMIIAFIGLTVGIILSVFLPYIRKVWQGTLNPNDWNNKYLLVAITGLIMSLITAFTIAPQALVMEIPEEQVVEGTFGLLLLNFSVGFGQTTVIKEVFEFSKDQKEEPITAKPAG